ncbi:MAG TPA: hypothetical protein VJT49_23235 [Amycolatopsis sp.]|uniref:hypothetical protein n=1 Tax=Amycolatopsis sp. TaxID=37632 RepID=UPI002B4705B2|nr:hypothetical protein [Amycolatopsis sp.]HKS47971.1 hypothetical protein [Amycolatopsis sp.]
MSESDKPDRASTPQTRPKAKSRTEARRKGFLSIPERPSRLLSGALFLAIISVGYLAAPAVVDPATVPRPWSYITDGLWALVVFGATSTLGFLLYCLTFFRDSEPTRKFLTGITQYAGTGAVMGTLLGCRMAIPLVAASKTVGQPFTFVSFLGVVSNTATMLTLLMIAMCWRASLGLAMECARVSADEETPRHWTLPDLMKTKGLVAIIALTANLVGGQAAWAVWIMLN